MMAAEQHFFVTAERLGFLIKVDGCSTAFVSLFNDIV